MEDESWIQLMKEELDQCERIKYGTLLKDQKTAQLLE